MLATLSLFGQSTSRKRKLQFSRIRSTTSGSNMHPSSRNSAGTLISLPTRTRVKKTRRAPPRFLGAGRTAPLALFVFCARLRQALHFAANRPGRQERTINHPPVAPSLFAERPIGHHNVGFAIVFCAENFLGIGLC